MTFVRTRTAQGFKELKSVVYFLCIVRQEQCTQIEILSVYFTSTADLWVNAAAFVTITPPFFCRLQVTGDSSEKLRGGLQVISLAVHFIHVCECIAIYKRNNMFSKRSCITCIAGTWKYVFRNSPSSSNIIMRSHNAPPAWGGKRRAASRSQHLDWGLRQVNVVSRMALVSGVVPGGLSWPKTLTPRPWAHNT